MKDDKKKPDKKSPKQHKKEKLTRRDLEDLMGINQQIYTRHNGAIRRKR